MPPEALHATLRLHRGGPDAFALDVSVQVEPGITVLFGPSGSGKSTLLSLLSGLLRPDAGSVRLGGQLWSDSATGHWLPTHQRGLALVFQSPSLFPHLSVLANAAFGADRRLPRAQRLAHAQGVLDRMQVGHLAARRPRSLSGGEAQRVAVARALASQPRLMLLDEAFSALQQDLRAALVRAVRDHVHQAGIPLVYVTHDRDEARSIADRVLVLGGGRIVAQGGAEVLDAGPSP